MINIFQRLNRKLTTQSTNYAISLRNPLYCIRIITYLFLSFRCFHLRCNSKFNHSLLESNFDFWKPISKIGSQLSWIFCQSKGSMPMACFAWFDKRFKNHWIRTDLTGLSSKGLKCTKMLDLSIVVHSIHLDISKSLWSIFN